MRYVILNLFCLGILFYSSCLLGVEKEEADVDSEETQNYEPDYDAIIREGERAAGVYDSWNAWGN